MQGLRTWYLLLKWKSVKGGHLAQFLQGGAEINAGP